MPSSARNRLVTAGALAMIVSVLVTACGDRLLEVEFENTPVGNFEALWHELDSYYALFEVRDIDWDSLYSVYRPLVNDGSTNTELYNAMAGLLSHLQDEHVRLYADGFPLFRSGSDKEWLLFSDSDPDSFYEDRDAMINTALFYYMDSIYVSAKEYDQPGGFSGYGYISPDYTDLNIGYILVLHFSLSESPTAYYNAAIKAFKDCDGIIIDMRVNRGGSTGTSDALLHRFADKDRGYIIDRYRNGPGHGDFSVGDVDSMHPTDNAIDDIPLAVLTSRFTASAGEDFTLGMMVLPMATVMGDTTVGIMGSVVKKVLPNGWEFTLSPNLSMSIAGVCYEGIGIPPEIHVIASRAEVDAGRDAVIDMAIEFLESAAP